MDPCYNDKSTVEGKKMNISDRQKIQKAIISTLSAGPNTWQAIQRSALSCNVAKNDPTQIRVILNGLISAGIIKRRDHRVGPEISKSLGFKINYLECYSLAG